jgi:hypothetical protein
VQGLKIEKSRLSQFEKVISNNICGSIRNYNRAVLASVLERESLEALGKTVEICLKAVFGRILVLNRATGDELFLREKKYFLQISEEKIRFLTALYCDF